MAQTVDEEMARKLLRPSPQLAELLKLGASQAERYPAEVQRIHDLIQRFADESEEERAAILRELDALSAAIAQ